MGRISSGEHTIFISEGMETVVVATRSEATDKRSGKCMIVQVLLVLFDVHQRYFSSKLNFQTYFEIDRKF